MVVAPSLSALVLIWLQSRGEAPKFLLLKNPHPTHRRNFLTIIMATKIKMHTLYVHSPVTVDSPHQKISKLSSAATLHPSGDDPQLLAAALGHDSPVCTG